MKVKELIRELCEFPDLNADVLVDNDNDDVMREPVGLSFEPKLYSVVIEVSHD